MTLPTVVPVNFDLTVNSFNKVKSDRSGALRSSVFTVTVPTASPAGTIIGLVPVKKGARLNLKGSEIVSASLDSTNTVTTSIGVIYNDTVNNTSVPAQFNSASTTAQAGGTFVLLATYAAKSYEVTGDGWVAITTAAASTNTAGAIFGELNITYDLALQ